MDQFREVQAWQIKMNRENDYKLNWSVITGCPDTDDRTRCPRSETRAGPGSPELRTFLEAQLKSWEIYHYKKVFLLIIFFLRQAFSLIIQTSTHFFH